MSPAPDREPTDRHLARDAAPVVQGAVGRSRRSRSPITRDHCRLSTTPGVPKGRSEAVPIFCEPETEGRRSERLPLRCRESRQGVTVGGPADRVRAVVRRPVRGTGAVDPTIQGSTTAGFRVPGVRIGDLATARTAAGSRLRAGTLLEGLDTLILEALRTEPHPST